MGSSLRSGFDLTPGLWSSNFQLKTCNLQFAIRVLKTRAQIHITFLRAPSILYDPILNPRLQPLRVPLPLCVEVLRERTYRFVLRFAIPP
jgi:hypothetical protein